MRKIIYLIVVVLISISNCYSQTAETYYDRGVNKYALQNYKGAIVDYTKAIELDPDYADAYLLRGGSKFKLQDYKGVIADLNKAIELNPEYADAYLLRGITKANLQDLRGAIADFTQAIENKPDDADAYYYRGIAKLQLDQKDSGCLDLSKAGELGHPEAYDVIRKFCNSLDKDKQTSVTRNPKETWILKKSSTGKFNILFPTNPSYSKDGAMDRWLAKDKDGKVVYRIATSEGPSPPPSNPKYQLETNLLPSLVGNDILLTKNFSKYKGYDALDFIYKSSTDKNGRYTKGRAILAGRRIYVLLIQYYHSELVDFDKFANSLTIL